MEFHSPPRSTMLEDATAGGATIGEQSAAVHTVVAMVKYASVLARTDRRVRRATFIHSSVVFGLVVFSDFEDVSSVVSLVPAAASVLIAASLFIVLSVCAVGSVEGFFAS